MNTCSICQSAYEQPRNAREKLTCSPSCAQIRKRQLKLEREGIVLNEYDKLGMTATEACQTLEPVSRREYQKIMDGFFSMVLTPAEEVSLIFSEASKLGSSGRCRKEALL